MVTITHHHQKAEFCGPSVNMESAFVNGEMVIRALNDTDTVLLLFIVDSLVALAQL